MAGTDNLSLEPPAIAVQPHPAGGLTSQHPHPRRPQAQDSVSLRKDDSAVAQEASEKTSNSSSLIAHRDSSGETSNADNWFDRSNKNTKNHKPTFDDSDSPFNFENDDSPVRPQDQPLLAVRHPMVRGDSSGSSSEEYRSVIDDLTIENKRLKKKLRKFERPHDSPLQKEKLFEVRVHGLPPDKKRELEETLRKFASNLNTSPTDGQTLSSSALSGQSRSGVQAHKPGSSMSSLAHPVADSGYGSMTASGKTSTPQSAMGSGNPSNQGTNVSQSKDKSIRSYLHDIPEGLMPRHPTVMTEKSKKRLVVNRLEQIFGGRMADPTFGQQPLQQQEVSNTAARDEKSAIEATGRQVNPEGHREAPIMENETEDPLPANNPPILGKDGSSGAPTNVRGDGNEQLSDNSDFSHLPAEQRPTRPLDLDPHRAQDPVENIEYFRHLGFLNSPSAQMFENQSWIYLNLLINMAQLHTINVTNDFIKDAITEHSNKLELSNDGRKVRWKGSDSSQNVSSPDGGDSSSSPVQGVSIGEKRSRPTHIDTNNGPHLKKQAVSNQDKDRFAYRPIIPSNKVSSNSDESSDEAMSDAGWTPSQHGEGGTGYSSGFAAAASSKRPNSMVARKDDGPIIFYNNATFCTDLSGDPTLLRRLHNRIDTQPITGSPLGVLQPPRTSRSARKGSAKGSTRGSTKGSTRGSVMGSGRLSRQGSDRGVFDVSDLASSIGSISPNSVPPLKFPSNEASPKHVTFAEPEKPMQLEASGIGGVIPHDNIAITVQRQYAASNAARKKASRTLNSKLSAVFPSTQKPEGLTAKERIISTYEKSLAPSPLPPASLHFDADDARSDSDSLDVETSSDGERNEVDTEETTVPVKLGTRTSFSTSGSDYSNSEASDSDAGDDDDNADSQIDFLAAARAADPEAIRAREREYDAEMAERLAEEIPAGSSAATAGGGSGFNSPDVPMHQGMKTKT